MLRSGRRGVGCKRYRLLQRKEGGMKNVRLRVTWQLNIPLAANLVRQYHFNQSMRKTNFQLYFYIYIDIFNALDICVFNTHSLFPSRRKYLSHLRLHFFSYIPDNIKNFFNVFRKCRKGILVWNGLRIEAATGGVL